MKKVEIHFHYPILPFSLLFPNNKRNANGRQKDAKMMAKKQQKDSKRRIAKGCQNNGKKIANERQENGKRIAKRMIAHQNSSLAPFCCYPYAYLLLSFLGFQLSG